MAQGRQSNWPTTSRHARGYGSEWDKTRVRILKRDNGLCQCDACKGSKATTPATEVHHIVSKAEAARRGWTTEQTEAETNLQAINKDCHKRETREEQGGTHRITQKIGADGWPAA